MKKEAAIAKTVADAMEIVRAFANAGHMSRSNLAREAGLTRNALQNINKPGWSPTPETLDKLLTFIRDFERKSRPKPAHVRAERLYA